jgi:hypothetical protein
MIDKSINIPARTKIRSIVADEYKGIQKQLWEALRGSNRVSIALDTWSSPNKIAFLSITAYVISEDWKFQEHLIGFEHLSGSHTGENMARLVMGVLKEYEIHQRLFAVTADNAANNNTLRKHLALLLQRDHKVAWYPEANRIPCLAHVIQLIVQEMVRSLKVEPTQDSPATSWDPAQLENLTDSTHFGTTIQKVIDQSNGQM